MKKYTLCSIAIAALVTLGGCTAPEPSPPAETAEDATTPPAGLPEIAIEAPESEAPYSEAGSQTDLAPIVLEPFTIDALHIGDLSKGHFNLYVKGGDPEVVRAWVGDEAATDALVTLAEFEVDHHCAHIEVPQPLPAAAKLWVEIETAEGARMKGSTAVQ